jgi:hypothetical protein
MAGPSDKAMLSKAELTGIENVGAFRAWNTYSESFLLRLLVPILNVAYIGLQVNVNTSDTIPASQRSITKLYTMAGKICLPKDTGGWYHEQITILPEGQAAACLVVHRTFFFDRKTMPEALCQTVKESLKFDVRTDVREQPHFGMVCKAGSSTI